jgi:hypothetical protein
LTAWLIITGCVDREMRHFATKRVERSSFSASHPHLTSTFSEPVEQRFATDRVKMSGDFIKEQDRAARDFVRNQIGMSKDDPHQQCLLLARGTARCGLALGDMRDGQIGAVRANERPPGSRIASAA